MTELKWRLFGLFSAAGAAMVMMVASLIEAFGTMVPPFVWLILAVALGWYGSTLSTSKPFVFKIGLPSVLSGAMLMIGGIRLYEQCINYSYWYWNEIGFPTFWICIAAAVLFFAIARKVKEPEAITPKS